MKYALMTLFLPPFAVCRYGCAGCCAAPIAVFWIAAVVALLFAPAGGLAGLTETSWEMVGLGLSLWIVATAWTAITTRGVGKDGCTDGTTAFCRTIQPDSDEKTDPLEEMRKAR
jgi:hypothetical protein